MSDKQEIILPNEEINNSLGGLIDNLTYGAGGQGGAGTAVGQLYTFFDNLRYILISNYRQTLSEMYVEHGIIQTLVDQPVDDAFRSGFKIISEQLSQDEKEELQIAFEQEGILEEIGMSMKWARLYGGGALIIITKQAPETPLDLDGIFDFSDVEFLAADMWELYHDGQVANGGGIKGPTEGIEKPFDDNVEFYNYYGYKIHKTRVLRVEGKQAPAFIRTRLRGWGMSEIERLVRSLNQYLKNQNVIFELLDEAKIDIYGIKGLNSSLMSAQGTNKIAERVQMSNTLKNFQNAITMDTEDSYEQKQMAFTGLSEMLVQIRLGIAADLKMPVTKLFGMSATGFNSGEDDIENYNSMIDSEIRKKSKPLILQVLAILSKKLFDVVPDDMQIEFEPLRILSSEQEETVKDKKFSRVMASYAAGIISPEQTKEALNADNLLPVEIDEDDTVHENVTVDLTEF